MEKNSHRKKGIDRILDVLSKNRDGLRFTEILKKADFSRAMTNIHLKKLREQGKVERTIDRRYMITEDGLIAKDRLSNVELLFRTMGVMKERIEKPYKGKRRYYPVIPIETTLCLTPEMKEFMIEEIDEDIGLTDFINSDIFCELQFLFIQKKVEYIVNNWIEYKIRMMKPDERKSFLKKFYKERLQSMTTDRQERYLKRVNEKYSTKENEIIDMEPKPLNIDNVLDFETGLFVKISGKEFLKRMDGEILRNRLSLFLLDWLRKQSSLLVPMLSELVVKGGFLTEKEFDNLTKEDRAISETALIAGRIKYEELGWLAPEKNNTKKGNY